MTDCRACDGETCRGGNDPDCALRDPHPSRIAGILDPYGGVSTVVAHEETIHCHARPYEVVCVVPDFLVHEPVGWNDIPAAVEIAHKAVEDWVARIGMPNNPDHQQAIKMYRLRQLEALTSKRALNLELIVET